MVEVGRGIRNGKHGNKIFGVQIRRVPERIGPAAARNGTRRETSPGCSRREGLTLRGLVQIPNSGAAAKRAKRRTPRYRRQGPGTSHLEKVIVAAAGLCVSRAARPYHPLGRAQSQTTLP